MINHKKRRDFGQDMVKMAMSQRNLQFGVKHSNYYTKSRSINHPMEFKSPMILFAYGMKMVVDHS